MASRSPAFLLELPNREVTQGGPLVVGRHSQGPFLEEEAALEQSLYLHFVVVIVNISQVKNLEIT